MLNIVNVLDDAEGMAALCCLVVGKVPFDDDVRLFDDALPSLSVEGVHEVDVVDASGVLDLTLSFVDVDVDVALFSDVDLDDDELVEVVGKVPHVDVKGTVLKDPYDDNVDVDVILYVVL